MLTNHHILMDGWSTAGAGAGAADALCAQGRCRGAAAGDAVSRLSGVACARRTAPPRSRPGGRRWRGWRRPRMWRATMRRERRCAPEQLMLALSEPLTAALSEQARRAGSDAEHLRAGGVGDPAGASDRPRRRGVRRDGGGAAAGDCRHRAHGGAVHQYAAAAGASCRRRSRCSRCCGRCRTSQSRLMAHQHLGLSEIQGLAGLGELFDTLVVFENYPVDRGSPSARYSAACGSPTSAGTMPRTIR